MISWLIMSKLAVLDLKLEINIIIQVMGGNDFQTQVLFLLFYLQM